jgi:hypothetical protein
MPPAPILIGRYGALLPLFRLVGVPCIAAFVESGKPTASPRRSPETRVLSLYIANVSPGREPSHMVSPLLEMGEQGQLKRRASCGDPDRFNTDP